MGKVNAAHAATLLLTQFDPTALLVFGIGGAYPSSAAKVGDVALASEEIAGDEGVGTAEGFKDTTYMGIPLVETGGVVYHNHFQGTASLLGKASSALSTTLPPGNLHTGKFVTLSTSSGTTIRARELETRYRALCENMEGAAAAQVAALHDVPWLEIRGISNIVEDRDLRRWDIQKAAGSVQKAVLDILNAWEQ
jgi:futalosine hydrolase